MTIEELFGGVWVDPQLASATLAPAQFNCPECIQRIYLLS